jgi:uncharacterized protein
MAKHVDKIYFAALFNFRSHVRDEVSTQLPILSASTPFEADGKRFMNSHDFAQVQVKLLERSLKLGFDIPDFLDASYGICTAVRDNMFVVDADGNLTKCYADLGSTTESIGTLDRGPEMNSNLAKWMDVDIPRDDECRDCRFLPTCLGGCSKQWHEGASKDVICTPLRYNADQMIKLYFERYTRHRDRKECDEIHQCLD